MPDADDGGDPAIPTIPADLEATLARFLTSNDDDDAGARERGEAVAGRVQDLLAEQTGGHEPIDTWSGETLRPLDPDPSKIHLADIAHGLSNVGRFAGQGTRFYSVARHSVHVSREVETRGGDVAAQRDALVHDAPEAHLSDVPGPVKRCLPGYKHAERRLDRAVGDALEGADTSDRVLVKATDADVGAFELAVLFPESAHEPPDTLRDDPDDLPTDAEDDDLFLRRARELGLR